MDERAALDFAARWAEDWNRHDINALMSRFAEDVLWTSPVAVALVDGSAGYIRGKAALREYYQRGLERIPDLHFEVVGVYKGVGTVVINYRNQRGGLVNEVLTFDETGLVREGHGTYLAVSTEEVTAESA